MEKKTQALRDLRKSWINIQEEMELRICSCLLAGMWDAININGELTNMLEIFVLPIYTLPLGLHNYPSYLHTTAQPSNKLWTWSSHKLPLNNLRIFQSLTITGSLLQWNSITGIVIRLCASWPKNRWSIPGRYKRFFSSSPYICRA